MVLVLPRVHAIDAHAIVFTPLLPFYSLVLIFRAGRLREGDNQVTKGGRVSMYLATLANKHSAGAASTATPGAVQVSTRGICTTTTWLMGWRNLSNIYAFFFLTKIK